MKKIRTSLLLLTFLLGACSSSNTTAETVATQNPVASIDSAATESIETGATAPAREAVLSEIENYVSAQSVSTSESVQASNGTSILETGSVQTGENSRARLDLIPDGTIIRISPNSFFVLTSLTKENSEPKTKLELLFGQVYIILNGGSLDVETPSGVASVKGSLMNVTYSSNSNRTTVTCLEGHCTVEDEDEELDLTEGQAADFIDGDLDDDFREMTFGELGLWVLNNPDLEEYIEEFPELPDIPEDFDWNYDFNNDPEFEFFYEPEYDPGEEFFEPTSEPTEAPIDIPTDFPVDVPTDLPVDVPTDVPTDAPTDVP